MEGGERKRKRKRKRGEKRGLVASPGSTEELDEDAGREEGLPTFRFCLSAFFLKKNNCWRPARAASNLL